jgi:uncharacterized protein (DUF697 family)
MHQNHSKTYFSLVFGFRLHCVQPRRGNIMTSSLEQIRQDCYQLIEQKARYSAAGALIPIPLADVMIDATLLLQLIPEINRRFGLSPDDISHMSAPQQARTWTLIRERGSQLIGIVVTRTIIKNSIMGFFGRIVAKQFAKFIPLGGQIVAASIGYLVFKKIAAKHIEDCYNVAKTSSIS